VTSGQQSYQLSALGRRPKQEGVIPSAGVRLLDAGVEGPLSPAGISPLHKKQIPCRS